MVVLRLLYCLLCVRDFTGVTDAAPSAQDRGVTTSVGVRSLYSPLFYALPFVAAASAVITVEFARRIRLGARRRVVTGGSSKQSP